jgi:putative ABC transport system substrate-binding protein
MRRRDFIALVGGAAAISSFRFLDARAQQGALPVIGFVSGRAPEDSAPYGIAFRKGLTESGVAEGRDATIEYHWLDGQYDKLPSLMADLVRRRVSVIATPVSAAASLAAKAATSTIPIAFGVGEDPVKLGLVASLARPGGNATGINFFAAEVASKQLSLLHELVPNAVRIGVLTNPANATNTESTLRDVREAASALGLETQVVEARNVSEVDAAFGTLARERAGALFVAPDAFLSSRRLQFALLAAHYGIPTAYTERGSVEAGGLISYGSDIVDAYRQVGSYAGRILKGSKPADLPVQQSTKFELVINLITAKVLGIEVSASLLARADGLIE